MIGGMLIYKFRAFHNCLDRNLIIHIIMPMGVLFLLFFLLQNSEVLHFISLFKYLNRTDNYSKILNILDLTFALM